MRIDQYELLVSEIGEPGYPGNLGDSCANTCRYWNLLAYLGQVQVAAPYGLFVTPIGFVRHPESIWREDDFPSDQASPLAVHSYLSESYVFKLMKFRIDVRHGTTDGHNLASPKLRALLNGHMRCLKFYLWVDAQLFKLPWRVKDGGGFESTAKSSCDYLNWFDFAMLTGSKAVSADVLWQKIQDYFKPEPNVQWLLDIYWKAVQKHYGLGPISG